MTKSLRFRLLPMLMVFAMAFLIFASSQGAAQEASSSTEIGPLPPLPAPPDNPITKEKTELGKMLFFDKRLSADSSLSCSSCHLPDHGWDVPSSLSPAYPSNRERRSSMALVNVAYNTSLVWDGRAGALEKQALGPIQNPLHMNMNLDLLMERLATIPEYVRRFEAVFGPSGMNPENLGKAIAAFERTLVTEDSAFDRYMKGEKKAMSGDAVKGLELFKGKARCVLCHNGPNFSDQKFHRLGLPTPESLKDPLAMASLRFDAKRMKLEEWAMVSEDLGRYLVTKKEEDKKAFKTPTLRNIQQTAPYMHDGSLADLDTVISFYNQGGGNDPQKSPMMAPLQLTKEEQKQLKAFLLSLTGKIPFSPPELPR